MKAVSPPGRHPEHGAAIVLTAITLAVLILFAALAMETFRLLTSQLQMENIAEYAAEVALDSAIRGEPPITTAPPGGGSSPAMQRVLSLLNTNQFIGQASMDALDSSVVCTSIGCPDPVRIIRGCHAPATDTFIETTDPCGASAYVAVLTEVSTFSQRSFVVRMGKLFNLQHLEFSTRVVSYYYAPPSGAAYVLTTPFKGTATPGA